MMELENKKVTVVGLARSGLASANLLFRLGARVYITELNNSSSAKENINKLESRDIKVEIGHHSREFIKDSNLLVVSPGVAKDSQALIFAKEFNIPVISELELAYRFCRGNIIAITGTNGKTTVTTLIAKVLEASGKKVFTLGNIGNPFASCVLDIGNDDYVSLEVSSFQLEDVVYFKPRIAIFLNFSGDHLDRYKTIDEYLAAKKRIFMNQDSQDYAVLNFKDAVAREIANKIKSKVAYFDRPEDNNSRHSILLNPNQLAVMAVAKILGIKEEKCKEVFSAFKGIEHRMEFVKSIKGVDFINDSKATNIDSTMWALNNLARPIILIAGGKDKNSDYALISNLIQEKVKKIIVIGQARDKIKKILSGVVSIEEKDSLEEAVGASFVQAIPGDCVLLSPMCASFDMFDNYEHRGNCFKEIVGRLD